MPFESLPSEVQIEIFSYLEGPNLKTVRGVCRTFRDNAEPTLFRYVIATARYQSLGAFQKISLFKVFQKHVREIVFDGSVYNKLLAKHEQFYHRQAAKFSSLERGFHWHKHSRWKRYAQLYQEQEDMKGDGVLVHTISRALEWMPNISCITYSPHPRHLPIEAKEVRDLLPRGVTTSSTTSFTCSDHPFRQLIAALYISQFTGIHELRTEALDMGHGTQFALGIFNLKDNDMAAGRFLFRNLEKIVLSMSLWVPDEYLFDETLGKFAELLRTTTNLQHLHFHSIDWKLETSSRSIFAGLGLQTIWPKLRILSLKGVLADEDEFSGMIQRHKETLYSVKFSTCSLLKGVWADVVDEVLYGSNILPFVLDCVDERVAEYLDYASLGSQEWECWKYEGYIEVTNGGDRNFVERNPAKKSVYESRKQRLATTSV